LKKHIKKTLKRFTPETAMVFELQWNEEKHPFGYLSRGAMYLSTLSNGFWLMDLIGSFIESLFDELIHNQKETGRNEGLPDVLHCRVCDGALIIQTYNGVKLYERSLVRKFPNNTEFCAVFDVSNYTIMLVEEYLDPFYPYDDEEAPF